MEPVPGAPAPPPASPLRGAPVGAWVVGVLLVVACAVPVVLTYLVWWPGDQWQVDLEVYREAGISVATGRHVYTVVTPPPQLLPFTYPPFAALLSVPLGWLPFPVVGWLWTFAQVAANAALVWYAGQPLLRAVAQARPGRGLTHGPGLAVLLWGALAGTVLWLHPVADGIRFGQVNAFLILLIVLDLSPAGTRPSWLDRVPRGVLIGVAAAIKLTPGIFVLYLLVQRRWREAGWAVAAGAAVTLGTWVVLPEASRTFWFDALVDPTRLGNNAGTSNQSLRGWLLRAAPGGAAGTVLWVVLVGVVLVVGFRAAGRFARQGDWVAEVATVGMTGVLVSPVSWIHHYHWVVVAVLALLGARPWRHPRRLVAAGLLLAWFWCRMPWWGVTWLQDTTWPRWGGRLLQNADLLAGVATLAVLAVLAARVSRRAAGRPSLRP